MNYDGKTLKYFSTFSGIGGFELGIERACSGLVGKRGETSSLPSGRETKLSAGTNNQQARKQGHHSPQHGAQASCVGFSEIDKYAVQIYQRHFPEHRNYGDITKINAETLPDFDLLVGGFPCQAFSIAGKRGGFADTRGTLFFDLARILEAKRPRLFLFENVKGLLSHDEGRTFFTIISTLDELGYDVQWEVLNSKNFGVPQNRERIFIAGHLRGTPRPQVFPLGEDGGEDNELSGHHTNTLTARYEGAQAVGTYIGEGKLDAQEPYIRVENREGKGFKTPYAGTLRAGASRSNNLVNTIRRLTPTECERLQGYPDGWTEGVSDTQRYKTLGNSVTTNVIEAICEKLFAQ